MIKRERQLGKSFCPVDQIVVRAKDAAPSVAYCRKKTVRDASENSNSDLKVTSEILDQTVMRAKTQRYLPSLLDDKVLKKKSEAVCRRARKQFLISN